MVYARPRLNFVVQHLLGLKEALIGCFGMSRHARASRKFSPFK